MGFTGAPGNGGPLRAAGVLPLPGRSMGELFNEALKTSQVGQAVSFQIASAPWRPTEESCFDQRVFREPSLLASSPEVRDKAPGVFEELGQRLPQRDNLPLFLVMAGSSVIRPCSSARGRPPNTGFSGQGAAIPEIVLGSAPAVRDNCLTGEAMSPMPLITLK